MTKPINLLKHRPSITCLSPSWKHLHQERLSSPQRQEGLPISSSMNEPDCSVNRVIGSRWRRMQCDWCVNLASHDDSLPMHTRNRSDTGGKMSVRNGSPCISVCWALRFPL